MICAHCDHGIDAHFDQAHGLAECCSECVNESLMGIGVGADYVNPDAPHDDQVRDALAWACRDFDH